MTHRERFAPSPTGPLHLGHAFSAITAWNNAIASNGVFLIRIEDIDTSRARPGWEEQIYDDLKWLGLDWPEPVLRQSERTKAYTDALITLWERGLLYPCDCNRRDIQAAISAPQEGAPPLGPDGLIYPGTCRATPDGPFPHDRVLRLNLSKAARIVSNASLDFREYNPSLNQSATTTQHLITSAGDIVLARKDMGTSYHLSVVLDDAHQSITHVTRGEDLFEATPIQVLLQKLLKLPTPKYHHHKLIRDTNGKRLAKRDDAKAIGTFRQDGATREDIYKMIGVTPLVRT